MPRARPTVSTDPLVLRLYDRRTRSLAREIAFEPANLAEVLGRLALAPDDLQPDALFDLDPDEVAWLGTHCALAIDGDAFHVQLGRGFLDEDRPYLLHTGRELRMMLAGVKPLALFSDVLEDDPSPWTFPEDVFDPHVLAGTLVKRDYVELGGVPAPHKGTRVLLYALAAEAWRIDAFILMREVGRRDGWSDALERMEGTLLGYASWQNDAHLARRRRS
jgi:hypothetical protein